MVKPYYDKHEDGYFIRTFPADTKPEDLIWHRDRITRNISIIESNGWLFQSDDCLPIELDKGESLTVEQMVFHRLIKGEGDLILKIKENE